MKIKKLFIAADHAGVEMKNEVINFIKKANDFEIKDFGTFSSETSVDYPDYAKLVAEAVATTPNSFGILICGTGFGMAIAANKINGIRATAIAKPEMAALAVEHNNINVLCLSARFIDKNTNFNIVQHVLAATFLGDRHTRRIDKITKLEE
jgi:ribose 5-phosphate isomerase B